MVGVRGENIPGKGNLSTDRAGEVYAAPGCHSRWCLVGDVTINQKAPKLKNSYR